MGLWLLTYVSTFAFKLQRSNRHGAPVRAMKIVAESKTVCIFKFNSYWISLRLSFRASEREWQRLQQYRQLCGKRSFRCVNSWQHVAYIDARGAQWGREEWLHSPIIDPAGVGEGGLGELSRYFLLPKLKHERKKPSNFG